MNIRDFDGQFNSTLIWIFSSLLQMLIIEVFHGFGCVLLVMRVLPFVSRTPLGPIVCIGIMHSVCLVPSLLAVFFSHKSFRSLRRATRSLLVAFLDILALVLEVCAAFAPVVIYCTDNLRSVLPLDFLKNTGLVDRPGNELHSNKSSVNLTSGDTAMVHCVEPYCNLYWQIPLSLFLISLKWWENFVGVDRLCLKLFQAKRVLHAMRIKLNLVVSIVTMLAIIGSWYLLEYLQNQSKPSILRMLNLEADPEDANGTRNAALDLNILWATPSIVCIVCGLVCYYMSCLACKLLMQKVSFCIPMYLSTPTLVGIFLLQSYDYLPKITIAGVPVFVDFCCKDINKHGYLFVCAAVWWVVFLWINRHVWFPSAERIAKTEK